MCQCAESPETDVTRWTGLRHVGWTVLRGSRIFCEELQVKSSLIVEIKSYQKNYLLWDLAVLTAPRLSYALNSLGALFLYMVL